jgi:2-hydroxy-3-oxopropionate reductase
MNKITVIGLGIMGLPMAENLLGAGFEVTGFNRSPVRMGRLEAVGGRASASVAHACADADVVVTMLPDSPDVEAVMMGEDGGIAHTKPGALWIDMSTIHPDRAVSLAATARVRGLRPLDAPVSGGEQGAIDGTLSIMIGGDAEDVALAQSVFDAVGRTIVHVGASGAGQTVKAANQLIVAANIQALAEAVAFLQARDVDLDEALTVLGGGLAGSKVLDQKGPKMRSGDFTPGFRLRLHQKDLGIVVDAARQEGVSIPLGSAVAQLVAGAVARGDGELDHSALLRQVYATSPGLAR